jgi:hypothetical protein
VSVIIGGHSGHDVSDPSKKTVQPVDMTFEQVYDPGTYCNYEIDDARITT